MGLKVWGLDTTYRGVKCKSKQFGYHINHITQDREQMKESLLLIPNQNITISVY